MKAAIYARVSTIKQDYALQVSELRAYADRMGWETVEYLEKESSVKRRPVWESLMADARLHRVDVVLVWKMDRFARSIRQLLESVFELDHAGVRFIAMTQSIDTDRQNPTGRFLMHILAAVAEFERGIIVERVKAGVAEAKRQGKLCGRPKLVFRRDEAIRLRLGGLGWGSIARRLGVSPGSIRRACAGLSKVS